MITIAPSIEIINAPDYDSMLKTVERAGRVCYKSEDKIGEDTAESFIRGIIKRGHESVIEHEKITVLVTCDRGVTHEVVRHRIASYSQESTRYCNYTNGKFSGQITFIDPCSGFSWDLNTERGANLFKVWTKAMGGAEWSYRQMIRYGAKPEEARTVLPNSTKAELAMTMNLREWRHFIKLRTSPAAHPQMREVADMVANEFKSRYPAFFGDL